MSRQEVCVITDNPCATVTHAAPTIALQPCAKQSCSLQNLIMIHRDIHGGRSRYESKQIGKPLQAGNGPVLQRPKATIGTIFVNASSQLVNHAIAFTIARLCIQVNGPLCFAHSKKYPGQGLFQVIGKLLWCGCPSSFLHQPTAVRQQDMWM